MNTYSDGAMHHVTDVLESRAAEMGCLAFSLKDEPIPADVAMEASGPLLWALVLHSTAIAQLSGASKPNEVNFLPLTIASEPDAPYGSEARIQQGRLPMALALNLLDAALEHAICVGMHNLGYKPSEWDQLPENERVIPLEPYFADLQTSWVTEALEQGDTKDQILNWPTLLDFQTLESAKPGAALSKDSSLNRSRILNMSSPS
ncbi:hypothetical protein LCGC14_0328190 [marine sediment metagenome]|uniref:Uncharacterized protein n=1 Tax=marine sediment metagenome TaxID=412755 RepID=A0A0F9TH91_9ZZZZ